jgi:glycosyltransferase involved in cell wall biosynthesis
VHVACLNQDRGIAPGGRKGAAVHVAAMREAFVRCGAQVTAVDDKDPGAVSLALGRAHAARPLDLLYERYALGCDAGARFATSHGVPLVLEVNSPLIDEERRYRGLQDASALERAEAGIYSAACVVLAVSSQVAQAVRARGVPARRVLVRPNAVDTLRFRPRRAGDPQPAGVGAGDFVLGFHGRLRPWHGFPLLGLATARLLERGLPARLLLVGEGDFEADLRGVVPPARVTRLGWTPHEDLGPLVARFDVLPLGYPPDVPCWFSPLKLLEAMACGVVPVVPALGDLPRVVRHGRNGLVYPAGDLGALVEALADLHARPARRAALAAGARRTAQRRSWTRLAREVLALAKLPEAAR